MRIRVAFQAGIDRCVLPIKSVTLMAGVAGELLMSRTLMHRQPRLGGRHGRQAGRQLHAMLAFEKTIGCLLVTLLTGFQRHSILPDRCLLSLAANLMAVAAVDARLSVRCRCPIGQSLLIAQ